MTDVDEVVVEPEEGEDGATPTQKLKKMREERDEARREAQEYLTGWQRTRADYVNLSKRMREAGDTASQAGLLALARSVVSVFDSLEAAQKASADAPDSVKKGLSQVAGQLENVLREHGIERYVPTLGETFDPLFHEPMQTLASENEKEDNTVADVFQSGYKLGRTVIRPARVSVKHYQGEQ